MTPTTSARLADLNSLSATHLDYTHLRHHARVPLTGVTVAIAQAPDASPRLLNISPGGLLLDGLRLAPGLTVDSR